MAHLVAGRVSDEDPKPPYAFVTPRGVAARLLGER